MRADMMKGCGPRSRRCRFLNQTLMDGPPFSVSADEVRRHYGDHFTPTLLERTDVPGGMKGICAAAESAWLLTRR